MKDSQNLNSIGFSSDYKSFAHLDQCYSSLNGKIIRFSAQLLAIDTESLDLLSGSALLSCSPLIRS